MTLKDKINRRLVELGIDEDHMVDVRDPNSNIRTGAIYLEDLISGMIREFSKKRWSCDLNFWLNTLERVQMEQKMCVEDTDHFYKTAQRPYSDEETERMIEITSRQMDLNDIKRFIKKRILNYNK